MIKSFQELRRRVGSIPQKKATVAAAGSEIIGQVVEKLRSLCGLQAILVGDSEIISRSVDPRHWDIRHEPDSQAAAFRAVEAVSRGEADLVVKGACSTGEYMRAVLDSTNGLRRPDRVMGQIFLFSTPRSGGLKILSDAAVNIRPGVREKTELIKNAVSFARALGWERPRVALLAALETVNPRMQDTVDAAATAEMDCWRELECDVAGPISVDVAVSLEASREKDFIHPVAGNADIFIAPDLASANLFAKAIIYFAETESGGIVLGGSAPVVLRSRADTVEEKINSICMGIIAAEEKLTA